MTAFLAINGFRATGGRLTIPPLGTWTADFQLATSEVLPSNVAITVGDLTLQGTVVRMASFSGSKSALVVGGKNGWPKVLPPRGYSHAAGVLLSTVLQDAAADVGESIVVASDRRIGTSYARRAGSAERVLRRLLGGQWWIDPDGKTQTGARDSSPIRSPFTVESWSGSKGRFHVATETYSDWQPGRTFSSPTVSTVQTISSVSFTADNDGKVRLEVLAGPSLEDRLHDRLRAIVRDEVDALSHASTFAYRVAASLGEPGLTTTVDVDPEDPSMPSILRVPLAPELGAVVPPLAGTKCRIRFPGGDPTRAECVALASTTEHYVTVEALSVILHNVIFGLAALGLPATWLASGAVVGVINAGLAASGIPAGPGLIAQATAAASQASAMLSGPGATVAPYAAAIATALEAKLPNVSGMFPSVGEPHG